MVFFVIEEKVDEDRKHDSRQSKHYRYEFRKELTECQAVCVVSCNKCQSDPENYKMTSFEEEVILS